MTSTFRLTEAERAARYHRLLRATTLPEQPALSGAALRLLLDSATAPLPAGMLPQQSPPELQQLIAAGLVGRDGRLAPGAADIVEVMWQPAFWLRIEAAGGQRPGTWTAWLSDQRAVIVARSSEADEHTLLTAMPGWVPVAAFRWLGIGPRGTLEVGPPAGRQVAGGPSAGRPVVVGPSAGRPHAGRPVLPLSDLLRWLGEPDTSMPGDDPALAAVWAQPGQLWAIDVEPDGGRSLVLDAAEAGLWLVTGEATAGDAGEGADVVLVPLPPRDFWRLLLTFIARASGSASAASAPSSGNAAMPSADPAVEGSAASPRDGLL